MALPNGVVQDVSGSTPQGTGTFPGNVTVGNTIIVAVTQLGANGGQPTSITDNLGNTYTRRVYSKFTSDPDFGVSIWSAPVITGGACTIAVSGGQLNYDLEGMVFTTSQRFGALEVAGAAEFEQSDKSWDESAATGEGGWEDGIAPNIGPTASLTTASNLSVAVLLPMIFGGGDTDADTPADWHSIALDANAEGIGHSIICKRFASTISPLVAWPFVPNGAGSAAFWLAAMANFRLPAGGGDQAVSVGAAGGDSVARSPTVGPGAASVGLGKAPARAAGRSAAVAPGAVAIALATASGSSAAMAPMASPGPAAVAAGTGATRLGARAPAASPGAVSVAPGVGTARAAAAAPATVPGAVGITPGLLRAPVTARGPAVSVAAAGGIALHPAGARALVRAPAITPGPVAVAMARAWASPAATAPSIDVGGVAVVPGRVRGAAVARAPQLLPGATAVAAGLARALPAACSPVRQAFVPRPDGMLAVPAYARDPLVPDEPRELIVPCLSRQIIIPAENLMSEEPNEPLRWHPKDPAEDLDFSLNWRRWLKEGETITAATWSVTPTGLELHGEAIVDGAAAGQTIPQSVTTVWLRAGSIGVDYAVSCSIVTSQARKPKRTALLHVRAR